MSTCSLSPAGRHRSVRPGNGDGQRGAGAAIDGGMHRRNIEATRIARRRAETLFAHHDVLLAPSAAGEAPPITDPVRRPGADLPA